MRDDVNLDTIKAAAAGDAAAVTALLTELYPRVRSMVHKELQQDFRRQHRWILQAFSTGDIMQDVFLGVIGSLQRLDLEDGEAILRVIATMVRNRLIDSVRYYQAAQRDQRRSSGEVEPADAAGRDPTPSRVAVVAEQLAIFRASLDEFEPRLRQLLELRLIEQLSWQEIANDLAFPSEDAARKAFVTAQSRLLVKLRARGLSPGESP